MNYFHGTMASYPMITVKIFLRSILVLCTLALTACFRQYEAPELPVADVLSRSSEVSLQLESVEFDSEAVFEIGVEDQSVTSGTLQASGRFHNKGAQTYVDLQSQFDSDEDDGIEGSIDAEVIFDGTDTSYFKFDALTIQPDVAFLSSEVLSPLIGKWWQINLEENQGQAPISPDPRLLRAQSEVVLVTDVHGITSLNDSNVYHYDVTIDPDKFVEFANKADELSAEEELQMRDFFESTALTGELFIDAKSFYIHKIIWNIERSDDAEGEGVLNIELTVDFSNHNTAETITIPVNAQQFSASSLVQFGTVSTDMHSEDLSNFDSLPQAEQEQLIQSLIYGDDG